MRSSDRLRPLTVFVLALAGGGTAHATPTFPQVIQDALELEALPDCTLCHAGAAQRGTATTPFVTTLRSRGLVPNDEASLRTALRAIEAEGKDSDNDGVSDIDELRAGTDPNTAEGDTSERVVPEYGCHSAATTSLGGASWWFGLALWLVGRRRAAR